GSSTVGAFCGRWFRDDYRETERGGPLVGRDAFYSHHARARGSDEELRARAEEGRSPGTGVSIRVDTRCGRRPARPPLAGTITRSCFPKRVRTGDRSGTRRK